MGLFNEALKKAQNQAGYTPELNVQREKKTMIDLKFTKALLADLKNLHENIELILNKHPRKIIAISSAVEGEGVSTLSANYAFLLAHYSNLMAHYLHFSNSNLAAKSTAKNETVLIDFNLKNPAIHQLFDLAREKGLTEILFENLEYQRALKTISLSELKIITAGKPVTNSVTLLKNQKFDQLLQQLKQEFNYVILDMAPIIPNADFMVLEKLIDGVILVVQAGVTHWEIVQKAQTKLSSSGIPILGVALNRRSYSIPEFIYRQL
ncbi:CpsD/CapB family tyrosine-protein kinase [candidate division KSB1 bacterium]|nr:CpsD/CapB family tyrosine-protein kinase [candidate division KSB1 bacterium]